MPSSHPILCGSIAGRPGRFGVAMHNAAYRAMGLDFVYVAFGTEDTGGAVAAMRALGIRGLGVTMPHKQRIMPHLDRIDPTAQAIGAVNTVINDDGVLTGHNVDWTGAVRALREKTDLAGKAAAVVGAGGGARAIVYGLNDAGARVSVFNRTDHNGWALAKSMGAVFGGPPEALAGAGPFDLIAHATPVGLGDDPGCLIPEAALAQGVVVFDAVPMPVQTELLRIAKMRGCVPIPGVRMQLHQAACQFKLYTGREANLGVMESALEAAMAGG